MLNLVALRGYVQLTRPSAPLLIAVATFIGQAIALKGIPEPSIFVFPALAASLTTASSFVINDYIDVDIDRINNPGKPIPSGVIQRRSALYVGIALFLAGFLASLKTTLLAISMLVGTYGLTVYYNLYGKKRGLLGNIIVAFCVSMAFAYGSVSAINSVDTIVFYISLLSFLMNLGREIVQSIQDMEGDRRQGVRSVAILHGSRFAAILGSSICAATLILAPIIFLYPFRDFELLYSIIFVPEIGALFSIYTLLKMPTKEGATRFIKQINIWTAMILLAIIVIAVS
jgi:geranylgeranylglycerol-phosphate geranylgeranyltransferase